MYFVYLFMMVIYKGYYILIFNYLVQEKQSCTEINALSIGTITLLARQIYFMIFHHSDYLCNTFVNDDL